PVADEYPEGFPRQDRTVGPHPSGIQYARLQSCSPAQPSAHIGIRWLNSRSNAGKKCHFQDAHSSEAGLGGETSMRRAEMSAPMRLVSPTELQPRQGLATT